MSLSGNLELQARVPAPDRRLAGRQFLTVALLFAGHASYYFCRADFSVASRSIVLFFGLTMTTFGLFALTSAGGGAQSNLPLILIGIVAFGLLGPYSYLAGAMALDFGRRQGGATSSGFIDGVGYLGAILAGDSIARLSVALGWRSVFAALAAVSAISAFAAGALFIHQQREIAKP